MAGIWTPLGGQAAAVLIGLVVYSSDDAAVSVAEGIVAADGTPLGLGMAPDASSGLSTPSVLLDVPVPRRGGTTLVLSMTASDFVRVRST